MFGTVSAEKEVKVPASEAWKVYGTLELINIVLEAGILTKLNIQGDGSVGTILEVFFLQQYMTMKAGSDGRSRSYKEKFTVVDDERRVKETEVVEGGFLDLGFSLYRVRLEVIEKEGRKKECITRSTIEYELKEEAIATADFISIQVLLDVMQAAADYLHKNHNNDDNSKS